VVEDKDRADAIIKGRSETRTKETVVKSEGEQTGRVSGVVVGVAVAAAGRAKKKSEQRSEEKTEEILAETTLLRLTTASGDLLWAWDDTKPCEATKAQCAIADLVEMARD
jgi:hypothetical protein